MTVVVVVVLAVDLLAGENLEPYCYLLLGWNGLVDESHITMLRNVTCCLANIKINHTHSPFSTYQLKRINFYAISLNSKYNDRSFDLIIKSKVV